MNQSFLNIQDLSIQFKNGNNHFDAVDHLSLNIIPGETFGLVGESGCGKSVTALSILRLIPSPPGRINSGSILWKEQDILKLPFSEVIKLRGKEIGIIFQEPMTSFNPVQKIGHQISEVLEVHTGISRKNSKPEVLKALQQVEINNPERVYDAFPHELSGGMRQRAMIAMALILQPQLLIADEPTTALDVTVQAQILALIKDLQTKNGMSVLLITHNLGIIAEVADRVAVMYTGRIVEMSTVRQLFRQPLHPYTQGLLKSIPGLSQNDELYAIPGQVPNPLDLPKGCHFAPRCPHAMNICHEEFPVLKENSPGHHVACWLLMANYETQDSEKI